MRQSRVYLCDECRRRALRGERVSIYLVGPGEFYLDGADVYKCEHLLGLEGDGSKKVGKELGVAHGSQS